MLLEPCPLPSSVVSSSASDVCCSAESGAGSCEARKVSKEPEVSMVVAKVPGVLAEISAGPPDKQHVNPLSFCR